MAKNPKEMTDKRSWWIGFAKRNNTISLMESSVFAISVSRNMG